MRRKDNVNTELETWTRSIVANRLPLGEVGDDEHVLMRVFSRPRVLQKMQKNEPYSYIALDKMYRIFLLLWVTLLDLHQKKKQNAKASKLLDADFPGK